MGDAADDAIDQAMDYIPRGVFLCRGRGRHKELNANDRRQVAMFCAALARTPEAARDDFAIELTITQLQSELARIMRRARIYDKLEILDQDTREELEWLEEQIRLLTIEE